MPIHSILYRRYCNIAGEKVSKTRFIIFALGPADGWSRHRQKAAAHTREVSTDDTHDHRPCRGRILPVSGRTLSWTLFSDISPDSGRGPPPRAAAIRPPAPRPPRASTSGRPSSSSSFYAFSSPRRQRLRARLAAAIAAAAAAVDVPSWSAFIYRSCRVRAHLSHADDGPGGEISNEKKKILIQKTRRDTRDNDI